jgi:hypothetical protein
VRKEPTTYPTTCVWYLALVLVLVPVLGGCAAAHVDLRARCTAEVAARRAREHAAFAAQRRDVESANQDQAEARADFAETLHGETDQSFATPSGQRALMRAEDRMDATLRKKWDAENPRNYDEGEYEGVPLVPTENDPIFNQFLYDVVYCEGREGSKAAAEQDCRRLEARGWQCPDNAR